MYTVIMTENAVLPVPPVPQAVTPLTQPQPGQFQPVQAPIETHPQPIQSPQFVQPEPSQAARPAQPFPYYTSSPDFDQSQSNTTPQLVAPENRPQPEQLLLDWEAPSRPFKTRNKKYYVTIGMILVLISAILFFAGQFILIAVGIAAAFLFYVLSAIPPEHARHQITTYGIRTDGQLYYWEEMGRFWYKTKQGQEVLHIEVSRFPNHLTFLFDAATQAELTDILSQILLQEEPPATSFDKAAAWLQAKIQLDPEA